MRKSVAAGVITVPVRLNDPNHHGGFSAFSTNRG